MEEDNIVVLYSDIDEDGWGIKIKIDEKFKQINLERGKPDSVYLDLKVFDKIVEKYLEYKNNKNI